MSRVSGRKSLYAFGVRALSVCTMFAKNAVVIFLIIILIVLEAFGAFYASSECNEFTWSVIVVLAAGFMTLCIILSCVSCCLPYGRKIAVTLFLVSVAITQTVLAILYCDENVKQIAVGINVTLVITLILIACLPDDTT